jgi:hypothetical protein
MPVRMIDRPHCFQRASTEALDSRWAKQTRHRAQEIAAMLRRG